MKEFIDQWYYVTKIEGVATNLWPNLTGSRQKNTTSREEVHKIYLYSVIGIQPPTDALQQSRRPLIHYWIFSSSTSTKTSIVNQLYKQPFHALPTRSRVLFKASLHGLHFSNTWTIIYSNGNGEYRYRRPAPLYHDGQGYKNETIANKRWTVAVRFVSFFLCQHNLSCTIT